LIPDGHEYYVPRLNRASLLLYARFSGAPGEGQDEGIWNSSGYLVSIPSP
jgi:hypothetical protein